jgi:uncharacterized membrane protein
MTLTPRYLDYLEQIAQQGHMALLLAGAAVLVVANCYALRRDRRWLWLAAAGFWSSWLALIIWKAGQSGTHWRPISLGFMLNDPLWYDEAFTWAVARLPLDRLLAATAGDVHPPTWYLITHGAMALFGDAEWALRLPAALFGLASLALTYRLARALAYGRRLALWAVVMLAVLPGQLNYAQEARMYTLLEAAVLLAALGIYTDRLWMMAAGMIAALLSHNLGVIHVAVLAGLAIWRAWEGDLLAGEHDQWARIARLSLVGLLVLTAYLPWARVALQQAAEVSDGFWITDYSLGGYLFEAARLIFAAQPDFLNVHLYLMFIGLLAFVGWYCWQEQQWELLALLLGPALLLALASELWRPVFMGRALLPSLPFLALGAVAGLHRLPIRAREPVLAVLVPLLVLAMVWPAKASADSLTLAEAIEDEYQDGDVIYHANLASYILLGYYLPNYPHAVWPDAGNLDQALTLTTQRAMGINRAHSWNLVDEHQLVLVWIENPMTTSDEVDELEAALNLGRSEKLADWDLPSTSLATIELWRIK